MVIAGWPVQFLPPTSPLCDEALEEARETQVEGITTWVFTAEHLAALALETGRAKDKSRLVQFVEAGILDINRFRRIIDRYQLSSKWQQFQRQFLEP